MTTATTLSAALLSAETIDDERFYEATALLSTRFDRRSETGDLRADAEAPQILFDWFGHAKSRVPDLRVWDLSCQVEGFFDPESGLYLPHSWPWHTRDRVLNLNAELRSGGEWVQVFERSLMAPTANSIRALACCAASRLGIDPYPAVWAYLCEHPDDGWGWHLIAPSIEERRLPAYLALAYSTLLPQGREQAVTGCEAHRRAHGYVWHEVLRLLQRFPGVGIDLLECAARSTDLGLRLHALDVLGFHWRGATLPLDTINLLKELASAETNETAQKRFGSLLQEPVARP